jgi:subtilisin family serine protease
VNEGTVQQAIQAGDPTTFEDGFDAGTSMETPHVAACAAQVEGKPVAVTRRQFRDASLKSCVTSARLTGTRAADGR